MTRTFHSRRPAARLAVAFTLILLVGFAAPDAAARSGALEGVVTDAVSGDPVEHAVVRARGGHGPNAPNRGGGHFWAFTDATGRYVLDGMPPGDYTVMCAARGYQRDAADVTVADGQTSTLDFALDPLTFGSVGGVVTDAGDGTPISGARVMLFPTEGPAPGGGGDANEWFPLHAVTGEDGAYLIDDVPTGDWLLVVREWGYEPVEPIEASVFDGQLTTADVALEPLAFGSLEGMVTDSATGLPVAGAVVHAVRAWGRNAAEGHGHGWQRAVTDADGLYSFDQMASGAYHVWIMARGYEPSGGDIDIVDSQTAVFDAALVPLASGSVGGVVTDSDTGDPVADAFVQLLPMHTPPESDARGWLHARTDDTGAYLIENVPAGDYTVHVWAHGYRPPVPVTATVANGTTTTVDVALDPYR